MKAGIVIEAWKKDIFDKRLKEAGFTYTEAPALARGCITLAVETDDLELLRITIQVATAECRKAKN